MDTLKQLKTLQFVCQATRGTVNPAAANIKVITHK